MAASGIAEHNEARRKERSMQKRAYQQKILMSQLADEFGANPDLVGATNQDTYISEINQTQRSGHHLVTQGAADMMPHMLIR